MGFCPDGKTKVSVVVKYILLLGAFIHWLVAVAMIACGAWAYIEKNKYFYQPIQDVYDFFLDLSIIMMVIGIIMFLITTAGIIGALRENTVCLKIFYIALTVVFLLECGLAAYAILFKDKAIATLSDVLTEAYVKRYQDDENAVIDHFQETYHCCGVQSYSDWNMNEYFNCSDANPSPLKCAVPYSCCRKPDSLTPGLNNILCGTGALSPNSTNVLNIWTTGCVPTLFDFAESSQGYLYIALILLAIVGPQLMGIVLGRIFDSQIQAQRYIYKRDMARGSRDPRDRRGKRGHYDRY